MNVFGSIPYWPSVQPMVSKPAKAAGIIYLPSFQASVSKAESARLDIASLFKSELAGMRVVPAVRMSIDVVRLLELRKELRHAKQVMFSVAGGFPEFSAAHRQSQSMKSVARSRVNRIARAISLHRAKCGLPVRAMFKPRAATAADRRIARQYDVEQTPLMFV